MEDKRRGRKKFWNSSLTKKMNYTLCILVIIPIIILGSIMIVSVFQSNMEEIYKENYRNMNTAMMELEACSTEIYNFWIDCLVNDSLIRIGNNRALDKDYIEVRNWIDEFSNNHTYLFNVCITLKNGRQFQAGAFLEEDIEKVTDKIGEAKNRIWYVGERYKRLMPVNSGVYENLQVFYAPINTYEKNNTQELGTVSIKMEEASVCTLYEQFFSEEKAVLSLVNGEGKIISSTDKERLYKTFDESERLLEAVGERNKGAYWENGKVCFYQFSSSFNQFLVVQLPVGIFLENITGILTLAVCAIVMCLIFSIFFGRMQKRYIVNPIFEMVDALNTLQKDEFLPVAWNDREDEIGILQKRYNKMVARLDNLINQVYRADAEKSAAQLRALTEQIKPHFLYNTLDSIHWKAIRNRDSEVAEQILALSDVYRYLLNKGQEFILIKDEVDFHERYLYLMRMRFGSRLVYESYVAEGAEEIQIPKLIIQPLLENAIVHGIEPIEEGGRIVLRIEKEEGSIKIIVDDTGIGFGKDINLYNDEVESLEGSFALKNINQRLKLYYKEKYQYRIISSAYGGSRIEIMICTEE